MARIPTFTRFTLEDFQGQKAWIPKLFTPLNLFFETVVSALSNSLTHAENMDAQIVSLSIQTKSTVTSGTGGGWGGSSGFADYVELFQPLTFQVKTKNRPQGVVVWNCLEQAVNPSIKPYGISVDWTYTNGQITVRHVSGLEVSKTYTLTLLVSGG